jgi:hypothetical protein
MRRFPLHTPLLAVFPVLFLYVHNLELYSPRVLPLPLLAALALAGALWLLFRAITRDATRASVLASLTLVLFFSYGHLYQLLGRVRLDLGLVTLGPHRALFVVFGVAWLAILVAVRRARRPPQTLAAVLNTVAIALVAFSLLQLPARALRGRGAGGDAPDPLDRALAGAPAAPPLGELPDLYYIILDGYARGDVLAERYGLDNAPLLDDLRARGFYVADRARANYMQTALSLASSLSLELLDDLAQRVGPDSGDRRPLLARIQRSHLARFLAGRGYVTVALASGYWKTEIRGAEVYLSPGFSLDEFQNTLIGTTPLPAVLKVVGRASQQRWHRDRVRFAFDLLGRLRSATPQIPRDRPAFVFAHIVCPHPPFVFDADGREAPPAPFFTMADGNDLIQPRGLAREDYVARYRAQIQHVNTLLRGTLDRLAPRGGPAAGRPAIVILQSDHGPGAGLLWEDAAGSDARERLGILAACRFPDGDSAGLAPDLTPVNLMRLVLDRTFGTRLGPLPDRSWFATSSRPYRFVDVTERVTAAALP